MVDSHENLHPVPADSTDGVKSASGTAPAPAEDIYSPIEISALFEKLDKEQQGLLPAALEPVEQDPPAEEEPTSLKLAANMTDGRPMGLLTSYFMNRAAK